MGGRLCARRPQQLSVEEVVLIVQVGEIILGAAVAAERGAVPARRGSGVEAMAAVFAGLALMRAMV